MPICQGCGREGLKRSGIIQHCHLSRNPRCQEYLTHLKHAKIRNHGHRLSVTFELNVLLDLSWQATTKSLCPLRMKPLLQVLSKSTRTMAVRVIRGDGGVGDIPGVRGGSGGGLKIVHNRTRLIQELRLRV